MFKATLPCPKYHPTRYSTLQLKIWLEIALVIWFEMGERTHTHDALGKMILTSEAHPVCEVINDLYQTLSDRGHIQWCQRQYRAIEDDVLA